MSPVVSSMRSRQTAHVGSSMRSGVGGGNGLSEFTGVGPLPVDCLYSFWFGVSTVMDLMKVTWQISVCVC